MSPRVISDSALKPGTELPWWLRLLPIVVLVGTGIIQLVAPDPVHAGFATAIVPLMSAFVLGPVWTGIIAALVTGFLAAPIPQTDHVDGQDVIAVAIVCATAVAISWLRERFHARLVTVESVSVAAQRAVLPDLPERVGDLSCAGIYHSAQVGARIGGDLYDLRSSPFGNRMILGDVQGHGLSAVSTASSVLASFHEAILDEPDLERVAARLERRILIDADQGYIPELFVSVLLVEFSPDTKDMRILSCGHPSPLLLRTDRIEEVDLKPGPVLGLRLDTGERASAQTVHFTRDETLLAFSDGVTEARDAHGRYYPLADRLRGLVVPPSPQQLIDFVWDDLARFADHLADDVSLLAVTRADRARSQPALG